MVRIDKVQQETYINNDDQNQSQKLLTLNNGADTNIYIDQVRQEMSQLKQSIIFDPTQQMYHVISPQSLNLNNTTAGVNIEPVRQEMSQPNHQKSTTLDQTQRLLQLLSSESLNLNNTTGVNIYDDRQEITHFEPTKSNAITFDGQQMYKPKLTELIDSDNTSEIEENSGHYSGIIDNNQVTSVDQTDYSHFYEDEVGQKNILVSVRYLNSLEDTVKQSK